MAVVPAAAWAVFPDSWEAGSVSISSAGTVVRTMSVTLTIAGQSPQSSKRREVVTYDGSTTARVVITQDGESRTCTIPLPRGRPTCG
jgi:hypothetical protein